ncbi:MAG: hypothetical protein KGI06_00590 [Candidatus Micrarchaeota archaeon]|nr:hypothetical protein [Candidatus Micrarchaeota archaeon]
MPDDPKPAGNNASIRLSGKGGRDAAMGKKCVFHPWRSAYAVCAYCHRPFCFEDIVEYNSGHYCLDDIDRVLPTQASARPSKYGIYMLSGIMLVLAFLVFLYASYGQLLQMLQYIGSASLIASIGTYIYLLSEAVLMALGLVSGILLLMQSRSGVYIGAAVSLSALVVFSYMLIGALDAYFIIIDIAASVSLATLIYLVISGRRGEKASPRKETVEDRLLKWPESGRF